MIEGQPDHQKDNFRQHLTQFNDKLIEKLRLFFHRESSISSPTKPYDTQAAHLFHLQTEIQKNNHSLQHPLLYSHQSFIDNPRPLLPKPIIKTSYPPAFIRDFDDFGVRRWEYMLCPSQSLDSAKNSALLILGQKNDFLTEDFSGKFESDSEMQAERPIDIELNSQAEPVSFLTYQQSAQTLFKGNSLFDFRELIDKLENRNLHFRQYECDQCGRKFYNPAALGGHKSKQHPKSSKRYTERKNTYSLRTGERKKRSFLNNL